MYLCSICESRIGVYKCINCGRVVCREDYVLDKKICRVCDESMCRICGKYLSINKCIICGRSCCEECLVQLTPVQYICKDCFNKYKKGLKYE